MLVKPGLDVTFYGKLKPVSEDVRRRRAGGQRADTRNKRSPSRSHAESCEDFARWIAADTTGRPMFVSDNNGFDWQFINWYFHEFTGRNPFGHSSTNLGSLYKGLVKDSSKNFKHLRRSKHTHHPVDDARGNAEALLHMRNELGLKIELS